MSHKSANVVVFPGRGSHTLAQASPLAHAAERLDLLSALQTTLLTDRLLPLFFDLIHPHLALEGFEYVHRPLGIHLAGGRHGRGRYQTSYNLMLEGEFLGEFRCKRQQPYDEHELALLERFFTLLIYPLRNSLLYQQALRDAHTDALTGLGNRAALQSSLAREWRAARRQFAPLSLIVVDVDYFKRVNDRYGHPCGDEVLKTVARCVKESTRGSDLVYRYGGEEFVALLSNTTMEGAALLAERIRRHVEIAACPTEHGELRATVSVGMATLGASESETDLLNRADQALYRAKQEGRNRVVRADDPASAGSPTTTI